MTKAKQILERVERIKPMLAGLSPDMQGAILADLTAIWLCGHPPRVRDDVLALQVNTIIGLIKPNEGIMFGPAGHPAAHADN